MTKKTETPQDTRARLLAEIEARNAANAAAWQGIRAIDLSGASYVLFEPVHGYKAGDGWKQDPTDEAVTTFDSPRAALESLQANPTSGDVKIHCLMNGEINTEFHAEYYPPNNRRLSDWREDWKFFFGKTEL